MNYLQIRKRFGTLNTGRMARVVDRNGPEDWKRFVAELDELSIARNSMHFVVQELISLCHAGGYRHELIHEAFDLRRLKYK